MDDFCTSFVFYLKDPQLKTAEDGLAHVRKLQIELANVQDTFKSLLSVLQSLTGDEAVSKAELDSVEEDIASVQKDIDEYAGFEAQYLEIIARQA